MWNHFAGFERSAVCFYALCIRATLEGSRTRNQGAMRALLGTARSCLHAAAASEERLALLGQYDNPQRSAQSALIYISRDIARPFERSRPAVDPSLKVAPSADVDQRAHFRIAPPPRVGCPLMLRRVQLLIPYAEL